jgi:hypothetical protein
MKTEEIKKQEELTDEQLDYVAGGVAFKAEEEDQKKTIK